MKRTTRMVRAQLKDNIIDNQDELERRVRRLEARDSGTPDAVITDDDGVVLEQAVIIVRGDRRLILVRRGSAA